MGWLSSLLHGVPSGFPGVLEPEESVAAASPVRGGGHLVATSLGLWVPEGEGTRRIGWHMVSKAAWAAGVFTITEAVEDGAAGDAVVLKDLAPRRVAVERPGKLPKAVHQRVTGSILSRHRHEPPDGGGGAWFVQRRLPGTGRVLLQVRPDPGADVERVREVAAEVAAKITAARDGAGG